MPVTYFYRPTNWEEISKSLREPSPYALALVEQGAAEQVAAFFDRVITILEAQQQRGLKTGCYVSLQGGWVTQEDYNEWHRRQEELDTQEFLSREFPSTLGIDYDQINQWMPAPEPFEFLRAKDEYYREVRRQMAAMYQIISQPSKIDTSAFFKHDEDKHNDSE